MTSVLKIIFTAVCIGSCSLAFAQKPKPATSKPAASKPAVFQKYTPPKLTCQLGIRSDSAAVVIEEALQLIKLPLKVTDDKKNVYTITSYQAMYKKRGVTEDEGTGKVTPIMSTVIDHFKTTPLSPIWIKTLSEQLRTGEELYFFEIVVKDAQGRLMFAPDLKIKVK